MNSLTRILGAGLLALLVTGCGPRQAVLPMLGIEPPVLREFPAGFNVPVSNETGRPITGWGGGGGGVHRTPVIFVHGNTVSARYWLPAREYFKAHGYTDDELWAPGYGWDNVRYFDSNDLSVSTLDAFVTEVQRYLGDKEGRPVHQFNLIGHSLGVTVVRQWMKQENAWHRVRGFVGAAGANHGVWTARMDARGQNRVVAFELAHGSPWLTQLNRGGETPGPTRYMTLYDGTGWGDVLFPPWSRDSSKLEGAYNLAYNVEHGTHYDHLELPRVPETMDAVLAFFEEGGSPPAGSVPPELILEGQVLRSNHPSARVHCEDGPEYPDRSSPSGESLRLQAGTLYSCFAYNSRTGLASKLQRFRLPAGETEATGNPEVTASPESGTYENPVFVELQSSDPDAFIVYTTSGSVPGSGSPLYTQPVYVPGPLTLTAVAIAPGGRRSEPLVLDYDISLELIEARHSLQRELDPTVEAEYTGKRKKGR